MLSRVAIVFALAACGAQPAPATTPRPTRLTTTSVVAPSEPPPPPSSERRLPISGIGAIHGVVTDQRTGKPLEGTTVIATSPALDQARAVITDDEGAYTIPNLPAGEYRVTFYYADITVVRTDVDVRDGKTAPVFETLQSDAGGTVIMVPDTRIRPQP